MELGQARKFCISGRSTKVPPLYLVHLELKLLLHTHTYQCKMKKLTEDNTLILQLVEKRPVLIATSCLVARENLF